MLLFLVQSGIVRIIIKILGVVGGLLILPEALVWHPAGIHLNSDDCTYCLPLGHSNTAVRKKNRRS